MGVRPKSIILSAQRQQKHQTFVFETGGVVKKTQKSLHMIQLLVDCGDIGIMYFLDLFGSENGPNQYFILVNIWYKSYCQNITSHLHSRTPADRENIRLGVSS